ncbi:glycoside hydrolase family 32 protein [Isoptericola variabilis]|uniref:Fructan beta-fructosidase n=1 Tax=Isoptericola variabilis (strain 225) TaxID=743718 RepID=F6FQ44_ISOV2|nr:glycoside hydrolase family 32 protein [Isoptericola variabilis]AEG44850.1 Fructan beta-fructosidase [Isoptericola variabilis 225]TWH31626.1 levanase/fructan beta-fructosidase/levanbiose-producing levanase [Isoptericola variabilis J7]
MTTTSHAPAAATRSVPTPHFRPTAHFTARDTWLNDPNGLLHHDGVYHLFFQNNPHGSTWGNMSWGHATSTDLVTWQEQPVAIEHTAEEHVFSGSAVADVRNTAGFAGPGQTALVAVYTSAYTAASERPGIQAQSLAYSLDGGETWTRYAGNPVLDIGSSEFRDPKVFWYGGDDGRWIMVAVEAVRRTVVIYSSPNLIDWTLESRFGPAHATAGVWECPDLFPLTVRGTDQTKWVLVVSLNPGGIAGGSGSQYFVGDFDGHTFTPDRISTSTDPADYDWLDYGRDYYAAVSFNDAPDGRRLMIGWASNWDYANATPTHPWRSAMSLVRELDLVRCSDGRLRVVQQPVLPADEADVDVFDLTVPSMPGTRTEVVLAPADGAGTSRLVLTIDGDARTLSCDRTASGTVDFHPAFPSVDTAPLLGDGDETRLRIVVDATIVEVYVDGGLVTLTQQVYPDAALTEVHTIDRAA